MKESLIIGVMCVVISIILNMANGQSGISVFKIIILLAFSYILLIVKFYYFAVLFAVIVPYALVKYSSIKIELVKSNKTFRITAFLFLFVFMSLIASFSHPLTRPDKILEALYGNYTDTLRFSDNGFQFAGLTSNPISFLVHLPKALIFGLFGPFLWQCKKIIMLGVGIENTLLLIFFLTFLLGNFKREKLLKIDIEIISLVIYISLLALFMAFASPNWGTLCRYKVSFLPFFLLLILNENPVIFQLERVFRFLNFASKNHF